MNFRYLLLFVMIFCLQFNEAFAQITMVVDNNGDGTWDDGNTYTSTGNIPNLVTENVTFNNNVGTVTLESGQSYTSGQVTIGNGNTLNIVGDLNVGDISNFKNFNSGNSGTLNVSGNLIIWGDLVVNNNLTLNVTGTLIIKGNVTMNNGGTLTIAGAVTIDGNFTGGTNTDLVVNGTVDIGGNFAVSNGSTATGSGTVSVGGTCADGSSSVCTSGPLPIELLAFKAFESYGRVNLEWSTATEKNNDYFSLERSCDGLNYELITTMAGAGNSTAVLQYTYTDKNPLFGRSYYRLKQTDFDGASETFAPIAVDFTTLENGKLALSPNPVNAGGYISIATQADGDEILTISVFNMIGEAIFTDKFSDSTYEFNLDRNTKSGMYFVEISSVSTQKRGRLVVK